MLFSVFGAYPKNLSSASLCNAHLGESCTGCGSITPGLLAGPFNSGPFLRDKEAVILAIAQIGDPLWFLLSAGLGIASLGLFVDLVKKSGWIAKIGELSLPLLFFASVFFHIINVRLIVLFYSYVQAYPVLVTIGITLLSLAISIPMAIVMQKLAPQLLGAPAARGPILPPLVKG